MREYKSFYKEVKGGEGQRCLYSTRLYTYGCGCAHDCAYCYAKSLLDFRKLWNPEDPAVASLRAIERRLDKVEPGTVLRVGGMTDCFQKCEMEHGVTKGALKMMSERGIGYLIVTKSDLVATDEYMEALDGDLAHIQVSVTSTSDEPNFLKENATLPNRRIEAALRLQEAGYDVSIRVSPYVPQLVDVGKLNQTGISKCLVEFLRVNGFISRWLGADTSGYTLKSGGYRHLPLETKVELLKGFDFPEMTVCEDVPEHYEYWKANVNANPDDCCNLRRG